MCHLWDLWDWWQVSSTPLPNPHSWANSTCTQEALILKINRRLLAAKARWFSATQSKQSRSEIRFPDLIYWPINCCGSQRDSAWHTFKINFLSKTSILQKWCGISSPISTMNLPSELNIPHWQFYHVFENLFRKTCGKVKTNIKLLF